MGVWGTVAFHEVECINNASTVDLDLDLDGVSSNPDLTHSASRKMLDGVSFLHFNELKRSHVAGSIAL